MSSVEERIRQPVLIAAALGYKLHAFAALTPQDDAAAYDVRRYIEGRAINALLEQRDHMLSLAASHNIPVAPAAVKEWEPNAAQLEVLRQKLRPERIRAQMADGLTEYVRWNNPQAEGLRLHQRDALAAVKAFVHHVEPDTPEGGLSGYIDMPTGTGKTAVFTHLVQALKSREDPHDPVRVLVLAPTVPILNQTQKSFERFTSVRPGAYFDGSTDTRSEVVTMSNAAFNMLCDAGKMPHFDAIVVDETHTGLGENISENIARYGRDKLTIGLTATPDYHDEKRTSHLLRHKIYELPLDEAVQTGILAPVEAELRDVQVDIDGTTLSDDPEERRKQIDMAYFKARLENMMPDLIKAVEAREGVLIRCPSGQDVEYARLAARIIRSRTAAMPWRDKDTIRAVAVGGSKPDESLKQQGVAQKDFHELVFKQFNAGEIDVVCYVSLINMGTDLPRTKLWGNLWPGGSRVNMVQGIGRALRLVFDKWGEPIKAKVIDYVDHRKQGRQYTCLDALNLESGHVLSRSREYQPHFLDTDTPEKPDIPDATLRSVSASRVASLALAHTLRDTEAMADIPVALTFEQACEWFHMEAIDMGEYLESVGHEPTGPVSREDVIALLELFPELVISPKPKEGVESVYTAAEALGLDGDELDLAHQLSAYGVNVRWLRGYDGKPHAFVAADVI